MKLSDKGTEAKSKMFLEFCELSTLQVGNAT